MFTQLLLYKLRYQLFQLSNAVAPRFFYHKKLKVQQSTPFLPQINNKKEFEECVKRTGFRSVGHNLRRYKHANFYSRVIIHAQLLYQGNCSFRTFRPMVYTYMIDCISVLENGRLKTFQLAKPKEHLQIKEIQHDNKLMLAFHLMPCSMYFSAFWDLT